MEVAISTGLDLLIAAIFIISIIVGMRKGLMKSVVGLFGNFVALVLAFVFSANLGTYIDTNYIHAPMRQWLVNRLSPTAENIQASLDNLDLDALFTEQPEFFIKTTEYLGIKDDIDNLYNKYLEIKQMGVDSAKSYITDAMITPISSTISRIIAFVLIFLACSIAIALLWWLSDFVANLPVIRKMDKTGGALVGVLNGFLISFITVALINITSGFLMKDTSLETRDEIMSNTVVYEFFNDINPLNAFFGKW